MPLFTMSSLRQEFPLPRQMSPTEYRCPCCGALTLSSLASMELCPVCWWEDDGQGSGDAFDIRGTVNGELSLHEARLNYRQFGAAHPRFLRYVRQPSPMNGRPEELQIPRILPQNRLVECAQLRPKPPAGLTDPANPLTIM